MIAYRAPATTRARFITEAVRETGLAHYGLAMAEPRPNGVVRNGRPYVAVACGCVAADCPGWSLVHDEPAALAHFARLFGVPDAEAKTGAKP